MTAAAGNGYGGQLESASRLFGDAPAPGNGRPAVRKRRPPFVSSTTRGIGGSSNVRLCHHVPTVTLPPL